MIIDTPRLHLRPVIESDVPNIQKYFAHWDIVNFIGGDVPWPYPDDGAATYFKKDIAPNQNNRKWFWTITEKERPDYLIGMIELRHITPKEKEHLGYWLALPFHGRGYMSEAVAAVLDYGFTVLDFPVITASSHTGNIGSKRVQEKQGMRFLHLRHGTPYHDGVAEHNVLVITREDWLARKQSPKMQNNDV